MVGTGAGNIYFILLVRNRRVSYFPGSVWKGVRSSAPRLSVELYKQNLQPACILSSVYLAPSGLSNLFQLAFSFDFIMYLLGVNEVQALWKTAETQSPFSMNLP